MENPSQLGPGTLRIVVIAGDPLARAGLAALLDEQPGCRVVGRAAPEDDLATLLDIHTPDAVVWDFEWQPAEGLERLADLPAGAPPSVVLLTGDESAADAWAAGARALLPREAGPEVLTAAIQAAAGGLLVLDPRLAEAVLARRGLPAPLVEELTPREGEVLQLLAEGLSNRAIAQALEISEHTVKFHVNAIFGKLGVQSRTEAAVRAARLGLILL